MARDLPPLNALRAFEAAARHQSFSNAAAELGVSHSSVSRHVRGLEDRLAVQLFRELSRGVALTPEGARYHAEVAPAFERIAQATAALVERPAGVVVVNAEDLFAGKWLVPRLGGFYDRHPQIELRLEASRRLADIDRYEADLAIRFYASGRPDRPADLISNRAIGVFAAPKIAAQLRAPEDLLRFRMLRDRGNDLWPDWFRAAGVSPGPRYTPQGWRLRAHLSVQSAVHGQGVLLVSEDMVPDDIAAGRLVRCFPHQIYSGAYYLVAGQGAARRKPVRLFRDWLLEQSAQLRDPQGPGWNNQPSG